MHYDQKGRDEEVVAAPRGHLLIVIMHQYRIGIDQRVRMRAPAVAGFPRLEEALQMLDGKVIGDR